MPGLDKSVVASINQEISLARIQRKVQSDFIVAPHDNAIFCRAGCVVGLDQEQDVSHIRRVFHFPGSTKREVASKTAAKEREGTQLLRLVRVK